MPRRSFASIPSALALCPGVTRPVGADEIVPRVADADALGRETLVRRPLLLPEHERNEDSKANRADHPKHNNSQRPARPLIPGSHLARGPRVVVSSIFC